MRELFQSQVRVPLPANPSLVLVTDLDGTLLAGSPQDRRWLYSWLAAHRSEVLHIFATGRERGSVAELFVGSEHAPLHQPHLVISDVGCTVACGDSFELVPLVVDEIERLWSPRAERVLALTAGEPGLEPQPVMAERRQAFYADPASLDPQLLERLTEEGVDCVLSDGRYLDVLPPGVNKGSTLQRVLQLLELGDAPVVVAGDTLNDLGLFQTGYAGIMVGNAEQPLRDWLPQLPKTYLAEGEGCSGILEGLRHFGFGALLDGERP